MRFFKLQDVTSQIWMELNSWLYIKIASTQESLTKDGLRDGTKLNLRSRAPSKKQRCHHWKAFRWWVYSRWLLEQEGSCLVIPVGMMLKMACMTPIRSLTLTNELECRYSFIQILLQEKGPKTWMPLIGQVMAKENRTLSEKKGHVQIVHISELIKAEKVLEWW